MLTTDFTQQLRLRCPNYPLSLLSIMREAWSFIPGSKLTIFVTTFVWFFMMFLLEHLLPMWMNYVGMKQNARFFFVFLTYALLVVPIHAAMWLISVQKTAGESVQPKMAFHFFSPKYLGRLFALFSYYFLFFFPPLILVALVSLALCTHYYYIPGAMQILGTYSITYFPQTVVMGLALYAFLIFFSVSFSFVLPLVFVKNIAPFPAFFISLRVIRRHWFKVFALGIMLSAAQSLSLMIGLIGSIWVIPWTQLCWGVFFNKIFGSKGLLNFKEIGTHVRS